MKGKTTRLLSPKEDRNDKASVVDRDNYSLIPMCFYY